ncbi:hypothetical protein WJX84_005744 [Apatococcus fuscideae]|uniref:Phospholipase/carboxylesterase/thioesterase domain-containing protein n=1 Tax=Apatococcus fuscideae TaxID=2026836 RepID=A0AAW1TC45_9CHLO
MSYSFGQTTTQQARSSHTATVIFLHGLGDTGNGWAPVGAQLNIPHVKFIFPTAPTRPVSLNGGMPMPAWFDLARVDQLLKGEQDGPGVSASVAHIEGLIQQEVRAGIARERIVVGGFSQGGHVALKLLLTTKQRLAGCIACSTWLEFAANSVAQQMLEPSAASLSIPVFIGHGTMDQLIPSTMANNSEQTLQRLGYTSVKRHMYPGMPHSSCPEELADIKRFILDVVPDALPPSKSR